MWSSARQHFEFEPRNQQRKSIYSISICIRTLIRAISELILYLCVGAALPLAFATGEEVSLSAPGGRHLVVPDSFFGQILPHFL